MGNQQSRKDWWQKGGRLPPMTEKEEVVKDFESLPKDIQRMVGDIPRELIDTNFEIFLAVIRFVTRRTIRRLNFLNNRRDSTYMEAYRASDDSSMSVSSATPSYPRSNVGKVQGPVDSNEDVSVSYSASIEANSKGEVMERKIGTRTNKLELNNPEKATELLIAKEKATKVYKLLKRVGKGGFGRVYEARARKGNTRQKVAVKVLPHVTDKEKQTNFDEVYFLRECQHPNIVQLFACHIKSHSVWVATEFMDGGTLADAVKLTEFTEEEIAFLSKEILTGVAYMHSKDFVHRDLKSPNIMLTVGGEVKLIDFGLCCHMCYERKHVVGSPFWVPPEMVHHVQHGKPADIWSTGICVWEMIYGAPPHKNSPIKCMFMSAIGDSPVVSGKWSTELKDFMSKMLQLNPEERWTAPQLLEHPFVKKACTKKEISELLQDLFVEKTLSSNTGFA